jgi:hypothetical protein
MKWLPDMDLNHDKQIQSLLCYRYTIGQTSASKLELCPAESRTAANLPKNRSEVCSRRGNDADILRKTSRKGRLNTLAATPHASRITHHASR